MTFCSELGQSLANQFVALILDNEVTVSHFVTSPALPWNHLIQQYLLGRDALYCLWQHLRGRT